MSPEEIEAWASAYIALQQDETHPMKNGLHPLFWAAEQFMFPGDKASVEDCWQTILAILDRKPPDVVIGMLAAGPLEDLIEEAGPQVIERIESEARRNPAFRHLLGGVWESSTPDIWARVVSVRGNAW